MKNNKIIASSILLLMTVLIVACSKDFIEVNLSNKNLTVDAPADGLHSSYSNVTFWWEKVDGATGYRLQIVSPGFASMQRLLLDTGILDPTTQFRYTLQPGIYQWRMKAYNSNTSTPYVTHTLYVDSTTNLSTQTETLISPANSYLTNQTTITMQWSSLYSATKYVLQVMNTSNSQTIINDTLTNTALIHTFAQGTYQWQVKAMNATSSTPFSSPFQFTINQTPPPVSALSAPTNGSTVPNPVALTWLRNGNAVSDSVYVASDSLFSNVLLRVKTTAQTYNYSGTSGNTYYWRLQSYDGAGNASALSIFWKFKVQ